MPKVSVIMSIYKEPIDWIRQSIDSILNQTFKDFEFLIVNDNPDCKENKRLLDEYCEKDSRLKIISNKQNLGLTKSLNKALNIAEGEYIARMDADDLSLPKRFEKQIYALESTRCQVCYSDYSVINENNTIVAERSKRFCLSSIYIENQIVHPSTMFSRRLLELRVPFYNEKYRRSQDYELWSYLYLNDVRFCFVDELLLHYRVSSLQISSAHSAEQLKDFRNIRNGLLLGFFKKHNLMHENVDKCHLIKTLKTLFYEKTEKEKRDIANVIYIETYNSKSLKNYVCLLTNISILKRLDFSYIKALILRMLKIRICPLFLFE